MSLQIIETGEVVDPMGRVEAERITTRIADLLDGIADNIDQVIPLIREALTRQAWAALDYNGPSDYISERFSGALQRLSPEVRRPFAAELSAAGMSTRAIAPIVGVSSAQVKRDVAQVAHREPPAASGTTEHGLPTTDRIVGMDGKQYRRPEPKSLDEWRGEVLHQAEETGEIVPLTGPNSVASPGVPQSPKPRRTPLTDSFFNGVYDLCRRVESVRKLCDDDRFPQNAEKVAQKHLNDLLQCRDLLQQVIDQLNHER